MFDAVIFDWDGTLADTTSFVVHSFQKILKEIKCDVTDEFIERRIGIGPKNIFKEALKAANMPFDEETVADLEKRKISIQLCLTHTVKLFEGTIELLDALEGKVKMALATMSNREVMEKQLSEKGLRKYFSIVITFDEVQHPKPNPEVFLKTAKKLGVQPERCVVVEDSIFGVKAAKQAKMRCIAVPSGSYSIKELNEAKPDLTVNSIKEIQKILNFILEK